MTGELQLEKPTVEQEVAWGLHFFDETLFEMVPEVLSGARGRSKQVLSGEPLRRAGLLPASARGSAATATAIPLSPAR